jgi:choline kinase
MKALILAAGMGTRLGKNTRDIPKCLVEVGGKPILGYQLEALMQNGVNDLIIVIGYKGHKIKEYVRKVWGLRVKFVVNMDYAKSNSSYSFWLARELVGNGTYIHLNCDIIFSGRLLENVIKSNYGDVIVIDHKITLADNMEQVILEGDKIVKMDNVHFKAAMGKAVGIAKFSQKNVQWIVKRVGEHIECGDKNQNFFGVIREAVKHHDFFGLSSGDELLIEVNSSEDLRKARSILSGSD